MENRRRETKVLRTITPQKGVRKSPVLDRLLSALPPGKRQTAWGTVYWETRKNRSDVKGTRL